MSEAELFELLGRYAYDLFRANKRIAELEAVIRANAPETQPVATTETQAEDQKGTPP